MTLLAPQRPQARRVVAFRARAGRRQQAREDGDERSPARPRRRAALPALAAVLALACGCAPSRPSAPPAPPPTAPGPPGPAAEAEPPACRRIARLALDKSERTLHVVCEGGRELRLHAALGREPEGPKRAAGDARTPEGLYRLGAAQDSRFHLFLPFDYPSVEDARRAFREGRIGAEDRRRIVEAHARGAPPPRDTPLGGGLGLHGEGPDWTGASALLDWTFGCIALSDEEIDFLAERTDPGTPIEIRP